VLVLDEPDAWLDAEGRDALSAVLQREGRRRAVMVATHRADWVLQVDRVIVLDATHRLEAVGPPTELLARSALFARLVASPADEALRFGAESAAG
jgi:ATP-binding cassette subfamily C protein